MYRTMILYALLGVLTVSLTASIAEPAGAEENTKFAVRQAQPEELPRPSFGTLAVRLQADGSLIGTVGVIDPNTLELVPMPGVRLHFIQHRRVIARAVSDDEGQIVVPGLSPQGVYTVVGRGDYDGQRWMVAMGVAVLAPEVQQATASVDKPATRLTAARSRRALTLEEMAQPVLGVSMVLQDEVQDEGEPGDLLEGEGGGGGGGGGGGAGGAGMGLAAGAGFAAASTSGKQQQILASPFLIGN